jgi:hypothetical protein
MGQTYYETAVITWDGFDNWAKFSNSGSGSGTRRYGTTCYGTATGVGYRSRNDGSGGTEGYTVAVTYSTEDSSHQTVNSSWSSKLTANKTGQSYYYAGNKPDGFNNVGTATNEGVTNGDGSLSTFDMGCAGGYQGAGAKVDRTYSDKYGISVYRQGSDSSFEAVAWSVIQAFSTITRWRTYVRSLNKSYTSTVYLCGSQHTISGTSVSLDDGPSSVTSSSYTSLSTWTFSNTQSAPLGHRNLVAMLDPDEVLFYNKTGLSVGNYLYSSQIYNSTSGNGGAGLSFTLSDIRNATTVTNNPGNGQTRASGSWSDGVQPNWSTNTMEEGGYTYTFGYGNYTFSFGYPGFTYTVIELSTHSYDDSYNLVMTTTGGFNALFREAVPVNTSWAGGYGTNYGTATIKYTADILATYSIINTCPKYTTQTTTSYDQNGQSQSGITGKVVGALTVPWCYVTESTVTYRGVVAGGGAANSNSTGYQVVYSDTVLRPEWKLNNISQQPVLIRPGNPIGLVGFGGGESVSNKPIYFTTNSASAGEVFISENNVDVDFDDLGVVTQINGGRLVRTDSCVQVFGEGLSRTTAWSSCSSSCDFSTATTVLATYSSTTQTTMVTYNEEGVSGQGSTTARTDRFATYTFYCDEPATDNFVQTNMSISGGVIAASAYIDPDPGGVGGNLHTYYFGREASRYGKTDNCTLRLAAGFYRFSHYASGGNFLYEDSVSVNSGFSTIAITAIDNNVKMEATPIFRVMSTNKRRLRTADIVVASFSLLPNIGTGA